MKIPFLSCLLTIVILVVGWSDSAEAANIVYVHGRASHTWPAGGQLVASSGWVQWPLSFDGSARLGNTTVRTYVRDQIRSACTGTDCVVVCHSAGCARVLLAYSDLAAEQANLRVLFTEALASAAGGSELASYSTNNGLRLLAKLFLSNPPPPAEAIDNDLPPDNMRNGTWSFIQGAAWSPMYHLAGDKNICIKTKIRGLSILTSAVGRWVGGLVGGPVGSVVGGVLGSLFGSQKVTLCSNHYFPGSHGDGVVPVHSAAGYADQGSHASHADGGPKYPFRAYEQVPLFHQDHSGIFRPGVELGSLRVAVASVTANQCVDAANVDDNGESPASIVYQDADSSTPAVTELAPIALLQLCGNDMFAGSSDARLYATCNGQGGCCDNFSTGATSGCTCGETLCTQAGLEFRSYFTGESCSGTEYSIDQSSWDGGGMLGATSTTVTMRSARAADGTCLHITRATVYLDCTVYTPTTRSYSARRVYRPYITDYAADPQGQDTDPGLVTSSIDRQKLSCPQ
jgi:hypothetical protein